MRKLALLTTFIGLIGFVSCQKPKKISESGTQLSALSAVSSENEGHVHNEIIRNYHDKYGLGYIDSVLTQNQVRTIISRVVNISQTLSYVPDSINSTQLTTEIFNSMKNVGYFNSAGNLKKSSELNNMTLSMIENTNIKNAISNINDYNGNNDSFLTFIHSQLNSITGLNDTEQIQINGYGSIIDSSSTYALNIGFSSKTQLIAKADADGFLEGWGYAWDHSKYLYLEIYARVFAAVRSLDEYHRQYP